MKNVVITDYSFEDLTIEIAILDLLGKKNQCPIFELLGYKKSIPKIAYASVLFGNSPDATLNIAKEMKDDLKKNLNPDEDFEKTFGDFFKKAWSIEAEYKKS